MIPSFLRQTEYFYFLIITFEEFDFDRTVGKLGQRRAISVHCWGALQKYAALAGSRQEDAWKQYIMETVVGQAFIF